MQQSGQVAQSVEQRTENPCVGGSIPPLATIDFARAQRAAKSIKGDSALGHHRFRARTTRRKIDQG
jgi:hypothetical protein